MKKYLSNMATFHKASRLQKVVRFVGEVGEKGIDIKRAVTHPHEEFIYRGSKKLKDWSKKGTGRKGAIRNRVQVYNPQTGKFVKINTQTGKILSNSEYPYKGVRKVKKSILVKGHWITRNGRRVWINPHYESRLLNL